MPDRVSTPVHREIRKRSGQCSTEVVRRVSLIVRDQCVQRGRASVNIRRTLSADRSLTSTARSLNSEHLACALDLEPLPFIIHGRAPQRTGQRSADPLS